MSQKRIYKNITKVLRVHMFKNYIEDVCSLEAR